MPFGLAPSVSGVRVKPEFCAPPSWFRGVEGVLSAWPDSGGPFGGTPARIKGTAAQRAGKRYERKALRFLSGLYGSCFVPQPWYKYQTKRDAPLRWCQPDGVLFTPSGVVIFEIKVNFTSNAWWQLRKLYEPVVRVASRVERIAVCVVCKSFDPAVPFPEGYLATNPRKFAALLPQEWDCTVTGVIQWTP